MPSPHAMIRTITPDERETLAGPPGAPFLRHQLYGDGGVWVGEVTTEPGGSSPWHHHGAHTTWAYMLEGEAVLEFGPGGAQRVTVRADGTLAVIPPGVVHRELNPGTERNRILIVRVGEGPPLVPQDGPQDGPAT